MPPIELAEKGAKNWKKKEAREYLDWFLNVREQRVSDFLKFLDYELTDENHKDLRIISELYFDKIDQPQFYTIRDIDGAKQLNDAGLAVAADMGLLISKLLQEEKPTLRWEIATGPKSYHSYNLPVLKEFTNGEWDPLFTAVVNTGYSLNVLKTPYDWSALFEDFKNKAK